MLNNYLAILNMNMYLYVFSLTFSPRLRNSHIGIAEPEHSVIAAAITTMVCIVLVILILCADFAVRLYPMEFIGGYRCTRSHATQKLSQDRWCSYVQAINRTFSLFMIAQYSLCRICDRLVILV